MTRRGLSYLAVVFISAAICLQPRVAVADTEGDVAAIRSLLSEINTVLTQQEQPTGVQPLLYDEWVHLWEFMYADTGVDPTTSAGQRWLDSSKGLPRLLWEMYQLFGNNEAKYLYSADDWNVWSYDWQNPDYAVPSFREFLSLVQGQNFDARMGWELGTDGYDNFTNVWEHAFTGNDEYGGYTVGPGWSVAQFWTGWQAEAWRRQLDFFNRVPVSNLVGWVDSVVASTNALAEFVGKTSSTNEEDSSFYNAPLQRYGDISMNTNPVSWYGPSGGDGTSGPELVQGLEWTLEGQANEVKIFGFDELDKALTGTLAVDFTSEPFTTLRSILSWLVQVGSVVCMFMILRHEVNYWTTLGGSAT